MCLIRSQTFTSDSCKWICWTCCSRQWLLSKYSQSSLFTGVRFLENPVNTELFHSHLHYVWMPLLITKIKNQSRENKEAASPCWRPSATLRSRRPEIFCLLRMAVNSRKVPANGKKMGYTLFCANERTRNTWIARIDCNRGLAWWQCRRYDICAVWLAGCTAIARVQKQGVRAVDVYLQWYPVKRVRALYGSGTCRGQGKAGSQGRYVTGSQMRGGRKFDQREPGRAISRKPWYIQDSKKSLAWLKSVEIRSKRHWQP